MAMTSLPATSWPPEKSLKGCKALYSSRIIPCFRKALVYFCCNEIAKGNRYMWYGVFCKGTRRSGTPVLLGPRQSMAVLAPVLDFVSLDFLSFGLAAIDAIHIAVLLAADADEFVSGERGTKPMFRVSDLPIVSIWESAEG